MTRYGWSIALPLLFVAGCGDSETSARSNETPEAEAAATETVFDPLVKSLERAEGVERILDDHAAEQRRRIEEAER